MSVRAFVFPGQGSQTVGMGKVLAEAEPAARQVFDLVDDALSERLSALIFDGDADQLTLTANAQPALMAVSMAVLAVIRERTGRELPQLAAFVAGHSLGEYSALAAAGAIGLADAARLLRLRGRAMQEAAPVGEGAMAALIGLDLETARACAAEAAEGQICEAANDNAPGQVVVSGHRAAVERALALTPKFGGRRGILLPVSAPFHSALMQPAADAMALALADTPIAPPSVPVVANVIARPVTDPAAIRRLLVDQITGAVRWRESVLTMRQEGVTELVEIGAGKVLTGLTRRIAPDLEARAVGGPEEIDALAASIQA